MKKIFFTLFTLFFLFNTFSQTTISLDKKNGAYVIPCKVNGVPMNFIFDTGATDVTISLTEAEFLVKQGLLKKNDIKESVKYQTASGEIREGTKINLRKIEISKHILYNISATIVHEQNAPLLLGMSALSQLGKIEIENGKLTINDFINNTGEVENIQKETKNTIEWINNKLIKHQYETNEVRQIQIFNDVKLIDNIYYLTGKRIQETTDPWASNIVFLIPLSKINNIEFKEKQYNYWLTIKIKNAEKAISITNDGETWESLDKIEFIINKSIDEEGLKPRIIAAIEYLGKLYANKQIVPKQKIVKYEVEGGFVEHIGEMLTDGWVKNSYDMQDRLVVKQEGYIDKNDKIKKLKIKSTFYNPDTGKIQHTDITPDIMMGEQLIGQYKAYYDNGNLKVEGEFYDFFKNGYEVYFGGIKIGTWRWYLENGEYDGKENNKVEIKYWENGALKSIYGLIFIPNDNKWVKNGPYYEFYQNELVPSVIKEYENGILINEK